MSIRTEPVTISDLPARRSVVVCCGSGGVGKTTISAATALHGARLGRKTCVVTIDPARRLANALGIDTLANAATRIDGPWEGELHALMLDPKRTFDELVHRYSESEQQAGAILANRIYRNLTSALSGTQEYMAMEKLYELTNEADYDLVVVDTPPTRNALDFLDAPGRLTRFLGHRLFQLLLRPTKAYLRAVSVAAQTLLRTLAKVAGSDIVEDAMAFFRAFDGMEEGFRQRAEHVRRMLGEPSTSFILVTSPREDTVQEATWFAERLEEANLSVDALVVNRVHPRFALGGLEPFGEVPPGTDLAALVENLEGYESIADREEDAFSELVNRVAPSPVARVPLLDVDVHDVSGLSLLADYLFAHDSIQVDEPMEGSTGDEQAGGGAEGSHTLAQ